MVHTAFSCNLQSRWSKPTNEDQHLAVLQIVEQLKAISAKLVKTEGKFVQLEFFVRTSEGRFQIRSLSGEAVEDLFARIAYVAMMPGHGGFENASVRAVRDTSALDLGKHFAFKKSLSCRSDASTSAGSDNTGYSSDSDEEPCLTILPGVRFSGSEEEIFFIADARETKLPEEKLKEVKDQKTDTVDQVLSNVSFFF